MTRQVISLVITSNDIPLCLPIALTYRLVPDGSLSRLTFLVHQISFIYYWELASYIAFVEKPTSRYLICWEALPPLSYCGFDIYSPTSHLLGYDLP